MVARYSIAKFSPNLNQPKVSEKNESRLRQKRLTHAYDNGNTDMHRGEQKRHTMGKQTELLYTVSLNRICIEASILEKAEMLS